MRTINRFQVAAMIFFASLIVLALPPEGKAQNDGLNKFTNVTFSAPVEVPDVGAQVLPAGSYVFKLVDTVGGNRNVVQILSPDQSHVYATILAIPNYRLRATDKTVMTFGERAAGQPEAIRAWFYPGDNFGQEFVYPKTMAVELAKITNEPVLATPIELASAPVEVLKTAPVEAIEPTGETVALAEVVQPPPVQEAKLLPQTASSLPLLGLIGLLSMCAGLALSLIPKPVAA
jgi:hypothetical protein